jgi:hypothetical protein
MKFKDLILYLLGGGRNVYRCWWESPKEKDHLEDQGIDGRMGIKMDLREIDWGGDSPRSG